jgi:hypothetical protein
MDVTRGAGWKNEVIALPWTRTGIMTIIHLRGRGAHHQVVRYSALIGGIFYGLLHQGTLQRKHDEDKVCLDSVMLRVMLI